MNDGCQQVSDGVTGQSLIDRDHMDSSQKQTIVEEAYQ